MSLKDLPAPSKGFFAVSYNVTVIQPQKEKPSVNQGSRVSGLDVQNGVFSFMMWLWVTWETNKRTP